MPEFLYSCAADPLLRTGMLDEYENATTKVRLVFTKRSRNHVFHGLMNRNQSPHSFVSKQTLRAAFSENEVADLVVKKKVRFEYYIRQQSFSEIEKITTTANIIETEVRIRESYDVIKSRAYRPGEGIHCTSSLDLDLYVIDDALMSKNLFLGSDFVNKFFNDDRPNMRMNLSPKYSCVDLVLH